MAGSNWLTLLAYLANAGITFYSNTGAFGATNVDLSKKYQTLITPAAWTFGIWGVIFIWELIFAVSQLLLPQTDSVKGIAKWWWATCLFQSLWSIAFGMNQITLAFLLMACILISLIGCMRVGDSQPGTVAEYLLIRAPLSVHLGWIIAASVLNFNVLADYKKASQKMALALAIVSLGLVLAAAWHSALALRNANPIICLVAAWALFGIRGELQDAKLLKDSNRFNYLPWPELVLEGLRNAAVYLALLCAVLAVVAAWRRLKVKTA